MYSDFQETGKHYYRAVKMNEYEFQMEIQSKLNWLVEKGILPAGNYYANIIQNEHEVIASENGETYSIEICFTVEDLQELNFALVIRILDGLIQKYQLHIREDQFEYKFINLKLIPSLLISEEVNKDFGMCEFTTLSIIEDQLRFPRINEGEEQSMLESSKKLLGIVALSKEELPELYGYACKILFSLIINKQFEMARLVIERGINVNENLLTLYGKEKDTNLLEELAAVSLSFVKEHFDTLISLGIDRDTIENHIKNLNDNSTIPF